MSLTVFHKVTKDFSGAPVLNGVSFEISHRCKVGLVGENGSGKSTILMLDEPTNHLDLSGVEVLESA